MELSQDKRHSDLRWWHRLRQNPVAIKELRGRMRGRRAFVVLTIYLIVMSAFIALVYLAYAAPSGGPAGPDSRIAGKAVFTAVLSVQVFLVIFIGPAFTAGSITGERERQTYDLLRTTLLTARSFVTGKLVSALSYVLLLIVASVPLQSIAFLLGGLSVEELLLSQLVIIVAAIAFALYGLYCSSVMRSTMAASVATFAGTLFVTIGIPILVSMFSLLLGPILFAQASLGWLAEAILYYAGLLLAATNLPATLIISEAILLEENSLFLFQLSLSASRSIWLLSPWLIFIAIYLLLALLFFWATVRRTRKIAER